MTGMVVWFEESAVLKMCPYCGSQNFTEMIEHPYPYKRGDSGITRLHPRGKKPLRNIDFLQNIEKLMCECGNYFFFMMRLGQDMNLEFGKVYCQIYKQGHYRYRDTAWELK